MCSTDWLGALRRRGQTSDPPAWPNSRIVRDFILARHTEAASKDIVGETGRGLMQTWEEYEGLWPDFLLAYEASDRVAASSCSIRNTWDDQGHFIQNEKQQVAVNVHSDSDNDVMPGCADTSADAHADATAGEKKAPRATGLLDFVRTTPVAVALVRHPTPSASHRLSERMSASALRVPDSCAADDSLREILRTAEVPELASRSHLARSAAQQWRHAAGAETVGRCACLFCVQRAADVAQTQRRHGRQGGRFQ